MRRALTLLVLWPGLCGAAELRIADRMPGVEIAHARSSLQLLEGQRAEVTLVLLQQGRALCARGSRLVIDGGAPRPCAALEPRLLGNVRWYVAEPRLRGYDNHSYYMRRKGRSPQPIYYDLRELSELRGRRSFSVSKVPRLASTGTHRLVARARHRGTMLTAPGPLPKRITSASAVTMTSLVVRRDDSYVGYLTELLGVPYVFAPLRLRGRGHQTDLRLGTDCISLAVYGKRREGLRLPYLPLSGFDRHTRQVCRAASLKQLLRGAGQSCRAREGDLLHLGHHVAVLSRDVEPRGLLGAGDLVIHALAGAAEEVPLRRLISDPHPVRVLRWDRAASAGRRRRGGLTSSGP